MSPRMRNNSSKVPYYHLKRSVRFQYVNMYERSHASTFRPIKMTGNQRSAMYDFKISTIGKLSLYQKIIKFTTDSHPSDIPYLSIQRATSQLSLLQYLEHPYLHLGCNLNFLPSQRSLHLDHGCIDHFFWMQAKKYSFQMNQLCPVYMVQR